MIHGDNLVYYITPVNHITSQPKPRMQSFINSIETNTSTLLEKLRDFVPKKRHTELESLILEFKNTLSDEAKTVKTVKVAKEKTIKEKKEKVVKEKKAKNPNAPKKPLSSYFLFVKKMTATVKDKNPQIQPKDVAKTLGSMWKEMSDEDKLPYTQQAAADRELYKTQNVSDAESNSGDENENNENNEKTGKNEKKQKKEKDPNAPKRPLSAYILFCNAKRSEIRSAHPDMDAKDVTREMGKMWRELSEQEQSKWKNQQ